VRDTRAGATGPVAKKRASDSRGTGDSRHARRRVTLPTRDGTGALPSAGSSPSGDSSGNATFPRKDAF
jgi:hypothetical protein